LFDAGFDKIQVAVGRYENGLCHHLLGRSSDLIIGKLKSPLTSTTPSALASFSASAFGVGEGEAPAAGVGDGDVAA
jgi:hypothetical protein